MTKQVHAGSVAIGGGAPISIQSMTNTDTRDVPATLDQIKRLAAAGCDFSLGNRKHGYSSRFA